jgi:hypothetical protein
MFRIQYVYHGSRLRILHPGLKRPRIRIRNKESRMFISDPDFFLSRISDSGGPKSTGSVSETLDKSKVAGLIRRKNNFRLEAHMLMSRLSYLHYSSATQARCHLFFPSLPSFSVAGSILSVFAEK